MLRLAVTTVPLLLVLAACSQPTPPAQPATPSQPPVSAAQPAAQQPTPPAPAPGSETPATTAAPKAAIDAKALAEAAQAAMRKTSASYSTLREQLTKTGWAPHALGACTQNVPRPDAAQVCAALPELNSCTAEGACRLVFRRTKGPGPQTLQVLTTGPIEDWNVTENSRLVIQSVVLSPPPMAAPAK